VNGTDPSGQFTLTDQVVTAKISAALQVVYYAVVLGVYASLKNTITGVQVGKDDTEIAKDFREDIGALALGVASYTTARLFQPVVAMGRSGIKISTAHIFHGEINAAGKAVGFHHRGSSIGSSLYARIRPGTSVEQAVGNQGTHGVVRAKVDVWDGQRWVQKTSNSGYSTFFPDSWSRTEVLNQVKAAYENRIMSLPSGRWVGVSPRGVVIEGYADFGANSIRTAYPVW
jgi:hypothetical protein